VAARENGVVSSCRRVTARAPCELLILLDFRLLIYFSTTHQSRRLIDSVYDVAVAWIASLFQLCLYGVATRKLKSLAFH